jgi:hypothetical protein
MSFFQKLGSFLAITAAIIVGLAITNWSTINKYRVQSDLRDFGRSVRKSTLSLPEKERLLDVLERLEDKAVAFSYLDCQTKKRQAVVDQFVDIAFDCLPLRAVGRNKEPFAGEGIAPAVRTLAKTTH